jgi:hypothetical protein
MDRGLALKAHKLSLKPDMDGKTLAKALGVKYAAEARTMAAVGRGWAVRDSHRLTEAEALLIKTIATEERLILEAGGCRSPKGVTISWRARKSSGWAASTAAKRLGSHRKGEDERHYGTGLRLVEARRNGHIWLTAAGWALAHAMEQSA